MKHFFPIFQATYTLNKVLHKSTNLVHFTVDKGSEQINSYICFPQIIKSPPGAIFMCRYLILTALAVSAALSSLSEQ